MSDAGFAAISAGAPAATRYPTRFAGTGAKIHHVIGAADGFFIVLDDEDGVAEIAEGLERIEQAAVVTRVQSDGRLIEDIEYAAQARADLSCQANTLGLTAGECGGGTIQGEIAQADVEEKIEPFGDFVERAAGNFVLAQS